MCVFTQVKLKVRVRRKSSVRSILFFLYFHQFLSLGWCGGVTVELIDWEDHGNGESSGFPT